MGSSASSRGNLLVCVIATLSAAAACSVNGSGLGGWLGGTGGAFAGSSTGGGPGISSATNGSGGRLGGNDASGGSGAAPAVGDGSGGLAMISIGGHIGSSTGGETGGETGGSTTDGASDSGGASGTGATGGDASGGGGATGTGGSDSGSGGANIGNGDGGGAGDAGGAIVSGGGAGQGGAGGAATISGCGPITCRGGCCDGNTCVTTRTAARCGLGGLACATCPRCFRCSAGGACEVNPMSAWNLVCSSATVAPLKARDQPWDQTTMGNPASGLPDPVCELLMNQSSVASTSVLMNTTTPSWNQALSPRSGPPTANMLTSQGTPLSIVVADDDNFPPADPICRVPLALTDADFVAGDVTFSNVESCVSLTLHLTCAQ